MTKRLFLGGEAVGLEVDRGAADVQGHIHAAPPPGKVGLLPSL